MFKELHIYPTNNEFVVSRREIRKDKLLESTYYYGSMKIKINNMYEKVLEKVKNELLDPNSYNMFRSEWRAFHY